MIQLKMGDKRDAKIINEFLKIANELSDLKKFISITVDINKFNWNPREAFSMEKDYQGKNYYFFDSFELDFNEYVKNESDKNIFSSGKDYSEKYLKDLLTLGLAVRQEERNNYIDHYDIKMINDLFYKKLCLIDTEITFQDVQEFNSKYI